MELEDILFKKFGYQTFKPGQKEVISSLLEGKHTVAVLPTGTGKSLCYQLTGYIINKPILIVSPLLSLMEDQVQQLKMNGEKRVIALNSFLQEKEWKKAVNELSKYKFIYASPEALQNPRTLDALKRIGIALFVVDEAHCISQWGHDFRLEYSMLGSVWEKLERPTCLALTATATEAVTEDIVAHLHLEDVTKLIYSVNRPNIGMKVERVDSIEEKKEHVLRYVQKMKKPCLIYCSSRNWTENLTEYLLENGVRNVAFYHGGMPYNERILIQQQFLHDQLDVICCTSAFGMGVNKKNVRFVLHFHPPTQLESYVQEMGRAGRDGKESFSVVLYDERDDELAFHLMSSELPDRSLCYAVLSILEKYQDGTNVSLLDRDIIETYGINEVHWRFIRFHLQQNGMIKNDKLAKMNDKEEMVNNIQKAVESRLHDKEARFKEMKKFLLSKSCRRSIILGYFQSDNEPTPSLCCDICGIDEEAYEERGYVNQDEKPYSWINHLSHLLGQKEEKYEHF